MNRVDSMNRGIEGMAPLSEVAIPSLKGEVSDADVADAERQYKRFGRFYQGDAVTTAPRFQDAA